MRRPLPILLCTVSLLSVGAFAQSTEIDRMVAVVDKHVITQSEWESQERFNALLDGRKPTQIKLDEESLDRAVNRELILEQIENVNFERVTPDEVAKQIQQIRQQLGTADEKAWSAKLTEYGLDEEEFDSLVSEQADVVRFIENRFRANARITPDMIETYYKQRFIPQMTKSGTSPQAVPPLAQVQDKIATILAEQRVDEMLNAWLESLRNQAHVRRVLSMTSSDTGAVGGGPSDPSNDSGSSDR